MDERLQKIYESHARFMALVESMPPPTEEQKQGIADAIAEQKKAMDDFYKERDEKDAREHAAWVAGADARQAALEKDPAYWKRLYLNMVAREEERKRKQEMKDTRIEPDNKRYQPHRFLLFICFSLATTSPRHRARLKTRATKKNGKM
jgi:hypothetical protein